MLKKTHNQVGVLGFYWCPVVERVLIIYNTERHENDTFTPPQKPESPVYMDYYGIVFRNRSLGRPQARK
jgi:hypothetical protein